MKTTKPLFIRSLNSNTSNLVRVLLLCAIKLRNVMTGSVVERTFSPTDKFQEARIERKEMQYLYNDGDLYYFMDMIPRSDTDKQICCLMHSSS